MGIFFVLLFFCLSCLALGFIFMGFLDAIGVIDWAREKINYFKEKLTCK